MIDHVMKDITNEKSTTDELRKLLQNPEETSVKDISMNNQQKYQHEGITNPINLPHGYTDSLTEASALLEVASKILNHHNEIQFNKETFVGLTMLIEQAKSLIDISDRPISSPPQHIKPT